MLFHALTKFNIFFKKCYCTELHVLFLNVLVQSLMKVLRMFLI